MTNKIHSLSLLFFASASLVAGCNTGSGSNDYPVFGPGSTGNIGRTSSGSTGGTGSQASGLSVGSFKAGPAMTARRFKHTATTLSDGRVLVTCGQDAQGLLTTSEVFDPAANTWQKLDAISPTANDAFMIDPTSQRPTSRVRHTATLMTGGQVLVAAGLGIERFQGTTPIGPEALKTTFIFDAARNRYTKTADLAGGRADHNGTLLSNGKVILTDGYDTNLSSLISADVYDVAGGTWTRVTTAAAHTWGSLVTTRANPTTLLVCGVKVAKNAQTGAIEITGVPTPRIEKFDAAANSFGSGPQNINGDRFLMASNAITSGGALFAGGMIKQGQNNVVVDTTEFYDSQTGQFVAGPKLTTKRFSAVMTEIGTSSDQLIVGGNDGQAALKQCEVFNTTNRVIAGTVNMQSARIDHRAVTLNDGRILVIGGSDGAQQPTIHDSTEIHTR